MTDSRGSRVSVLAGLVVLYVLAGKLGLHFAFFHVSASPVWPPTGIALGAFLLLGFRIWPAIFVGAFLVNVTTAGSVATSFGIASGNTLEGIVGAFLVNRFAGGRRVFDRAQDIFKFVALAALGSTTVSATVGVTTLSLGGYARWTDYGSIWLTWWLGDATGALIVAPLLLLWAADWSLARLRERATETVLFLFCLVVVGELEFGGAFLTGTRNYPLTFLSIPLLIWPAFRFGQREVATANILLSGLAVSGTLRGFGPFVGGTPNESLLLLQAFMGTMAVAMLPLAAVVGERQRVADHRRRADETFRLAVEAAPNAMIMADAQGRIVLANAQTERLFGYPRDDLLGQSIEVLVPGRFRGDHPGYRASFSRDPRTRAMGSGRDLYAVRKDGSEVPVEIGLNPITTDTGVFVLAAVVDITERKRAEEERARLLGQEQAARETAEAAAHRARVLADVSRALSSSLDSERLLGELPAILVPFFADWCVVHVASRDGGVRRIGPRHADPARQALADALEAVAPRLSWMSDVNPVTRALAAGQSLLVADVTLEWMREAIADEGYRHLVMDRLRPTSLIIVPLVARGQPFGAMTFVLTDGPRRYGPADLAFADDVARRAALAVDNARLLTRAERARTDAESANRAKDEFLAILSHELRTPLTAMLGWARMLRKMQVSEGQRLHGLEVIERNAALQARLIDDLLEVSRIIAGKLQIEKYPVDPVPVVQDAVDAVRANAEAKGVSFSIELEPATGEVLGDPVRLQQIVTNLLTNAVKFTPKGGKVEIRLARAGAQARLSVADTGEGIEAAALPHIFEPFQQEETGTRRGQQGLGLGLAIVRQLVQLHGGTVRAESQGKGLGAIFTVELPIVALRLPSGMPRQKRSREATDARGTRLDGLRVLVVDDHADGRDMVALALRERGAEVDTAASVAEALDILAKTRTDVLVSDVAMPEADGYDLIRTVRARQGDGSGRVIRAVALTAYAAPEVRDRVVAAGFDAHATKPINPEDLVELIARLRD